MQFLLRKLFDKLIQYMSIFFWQNSNKILTSLVKNYGLFSITQWCLDNRDVSMTSTAAGHTGNKQANKSIFTLNSFMQKFCNK